MIILDLLDLTSHLVDQGVSYSVGCNFDVLKPLVEEKVCLSHMLTVYQTFSEFRSPVSYLGHERYW